MATWPASLPQEPLLDGFNASTKDNVLRTDMDLGPDKRRRRYTWAPVRFAASLVFTEAEMAIFDAFVATTLNDGIDAFDWMNPRTHASISLAITAPYQWIPIGAGLWRTSLQLEEQ